jgi:hypothetical protein
MAATGAPLVEVVMEMICVLCGLGELVVGGTGLEVDGIFGGEFSGELVEENLDAALRAVGVELGGRGKEAMLGIVSDLGDEG